MLHIFITFSLVKKKRTQCLLANSNLVQLSNGSKTIKIITTTTTAITPPHHTHTHAHVTFKHV